jgi:DNA-binding CsgD family transcriptional regulator
MLLSVAGIIIVLLVIGLLGERKRINSYFLLRVLLSWLRISAFPLSTLGQAIELIAAVYYLIGGVSFSLFIVAWCQYYAEKSEETKHSFIVPFVCYTICLIVILLLLPKETAIMANVVLQTLGAVLILTRKRHEPALMPSIALNHQRQPVFFAFGVMIGVLMIVCPRLITDNFTGLPGTIPLEAIWVITLLILGTLSFAFLDAKKAESPVIKLLFPLLVLGLLSPMLFLVGLDGVFLIVIVYTVICESIVFASGDSGSLLRYKFGEKTFVFWERSIVLVGYALGSLIAAFCLPLINFEALYSVLFAVAFIYLALCLVTVSMQRKVFEKPSTVITESYFETIERAIDKVAVDFALTPREKEVLSELAKGRNIPYIMEKLVISKGTATTHMYHIHQKMGINRRQELLDIVMGYLENESL